MFRVFTLRKEQLLLGLYLVIIFAGVLTVYNRQTVGAFAMPLSKKIIMIDAGHGGFDPGKITESGVLEKDINLAISLKLQSFLELSGAVVIMTRVEDKALASKKSADMQNRQIIANTSKADLLVSIHQNSFPDSSAKGAQVFYFDNSPNSKKLAECIQSEINSFADIGNKHEPKANGKYYILKKTTIPAVIAECGFLTNYSDRKKLLTDAYQEKMAWAIYMGILKYYGEK